MSSCRSVLCSLSLTAAESGLHTQSFGTTVSEAPVSRSAGNFPSPPPPASPPAPQFPTLVQKALDQRRFWKMVMQEAPEICLPTWAATAGQSLSDGTVLEP